MAGCIPPDDELASVISLCRFDDGLDPPPFLAIRYGDLCADPDLGAGGGAIKISESGSGEIDSEAELSWLFITWRFCPLRWGGVELDPACSGCSAISVRSFGGLIALLDGAFRLCGFIEGDWRTTRAGGREFDMVRRVFLAAAGSDEAETVLLGVRSKLMSIGEVARDVSEGAGL